MDQHLDRLLRERGSALDHPARADVVPEGAHDREGIDPRVMEEARVLRGQGGAHERIGKAVGVDAAAALPLRGKRLAQGLSVARDDLGRSVLVQLEEASGQRTQPGPARGEGDGRQRAASAGRGRYAGAAASRLHRDHRGAGAAEDLRLVHLLDVGGRGPERAGGGGPRDVGEAVLALRRAAWRRAARGRRAARRGRSRRAARRPSRRPTPLARPARARGRKRWSRTTTRRARTRRAADR